MITILWNKIFQNKNQSWSFFGQLTRIVTGLVFVGVVARALTSELLATWYIFVAMFGFASLAEMGLRQVYSRHVTYMKSDYERGQCSRVDFANFILQGERFYFYLAGAISLVALCAGSWWLVHRVSSGNSASVLVAWFIYVCGGACLIMTVFYSGVVNGVGEMWRGQKIAILSAWCSVGLLLFIVVSKHSLLIPATAYFISQFVGAMFLRRMVRTMPFMERRDPAKSIGVDKEIFNVIVRDTGKMALIMVSYQILTNGFVLVLGYYLSNATVASYGLSMQFVNIVFVISSIWGTTSFYDMAAFHRRGDRLGLRRVFWATFSRCCVASTAGMLGIYIFGTPVLELLGSKTSIFKGVELAVVLGTLWSEFILGQFSQLLMSRGDMRIANFSFVGTVLICAVTMVLLWSGHDIVLVFVARLLCYVFAIALPSLVMSATSLVGKANLSMGEV